MGEGHTIFCFVPMWTFIIYVTVIIDEQNLNQELPHQNLGILFYSHFVKAFCDWGFCVFNVKEKKWKIVIRSKLLPFKKVCQIEEFEYGIYK